MVNGPWVGKANKNPLSFLTFLHCLEVVNEVVDFSTIGQFNQGKKQTFKWPKMVFCEVLQVYIFV